MYQQMKPSICPRFWFPHGDKIQLSREGFLWDPIGEFTRNMNPRVVQISDLREKTCLILLGEPGSGKSTSLGAEYAECDLNRREGENVLFRNLAEYSSDESISRCVFSDDVWQRWRDGESLSVFLDAFDECRLSLANVAQVLVRGFRQFATRDRLKLRLACRSAVWSAYLEAEFSKLWPDHASVYHIAPLRHDDAVSFVRQLGIDDTEKFFAAAEAIDAIPMATAPLSLSLLARIYREAERLPPRQELYERGCRSLCTEHNESREAAGQMGSLTPDQRVAIASRIAAMTLLCGRSGVWIGQDAPPIGRDLVTIHEASGGIENANRASFEVTAELIREVVSDTQLFVTTGVNQVGFTHRTYAEFLAARYLISHKVPIEQIRSIVTHPVIRGRIVPQLRGVAAWLASERDVLKMICESDPEVLFSVDVAVHSDSDRAAAIDAILRAARDILLTDSYLSRSQYARLKHSEIATQLRPVIADRTAGFLPRRIAIDIAEECCVQEVEGELLAIVLDATESIYLRINAVSALSRVTTPSTAQKLISLLEHDIPDDTDDNLRGYALRALWPNRISVSQVTPLLSPLKRQNHLGAYWDFIAHDFVDNARESDLDSILIWLVSLSGERFQSLPFSILFSRALAKAWESADVRVPSAGFGRAFWWHIIAGHDWDIHEDFRRRLAALFENRERRRWLLQMLIENVPDVNNPWRNVLSCRPTLSVADDTQWLIERLDAESDDRKRHFLVLLIADHYSGSYSAFDDLILLATDRHKELRSELAPWIDPIRIDSEVARKMRKAYRRATANSPKRLPPSPHDRVVLSLNRSENDNSIAWIQLTLDITLSTANHRGDRFSTDLTSQPGWIEADSMIRQRILDAADRFLREKSPGADNWFDKPGRACGDHSLAGVKALRLLRDASMATFAALSDAIYQNWTPAILGYPDNGDPEHLVFQREVLSNAYDRSPDEFVAWIGRDLVRANAERHVFDQLQPDGSSVRIESECPTSLPRILSECWDNRIADVFREFAAAKQTNPTIRRALIDALMRHGDGETLEAIERQLNVPLPIDDPARRQLHFTASSFLMHSPDSALPILTRLAAVDSEFCREVCVKWVSVCRPGLAEFLLRLSESQIADLYILLRTLFPPSEDPRIDGAHAETPREVVARTCGDLIRALTDRGTPSAILAFDRIIAASPDSEPLRYTRIGVARKALEASWVPMEPLYLLTLVRDANRRVVRSGEELLLVLQESIQRFEQELQGETPQNFTLWDQLTTAATGRAAAFRPKSEERLSDALRRHLERDLREKGVVTNREVQIRHGQGAMGSAGERTDIQVDAIAIHPTSATVERFRAIIEVKGCWHKELLTAMESQLRDRYLKDNDCQFGLYVVGAYDCPQWDDSDYKLSDARKLMPSTISEARTFFTNQATNASTNGIQIAASVINCALR